MILQCLPHEKRLNPLYDRCSSTSTTILLSLSFVDSNNRDDKRKQWKIFAREHSDEQEWVRCIKKLRYKNHY